MLERLFDKITKGAIKYKWITITVSVLVMVAGVFTFGQLNQELIPKIEFPQTIVVAFSPDIEADVMLEEYTAPFEEAVSEIDGVVNVETQTSNGFALAIVRNEFGLNQEKMRDEIQAVLDDLDYPEGMEKPELINFSLSDLPIISLSVSSEDLTLDELKELVESELVPDLESVDQVAAVEVSGGQELPSEEELAAEEPTPEPTPVPTTEPTPETTAGTPLPQSWKDAFSAQGFPINTAEELNAEIVSAIVGFAPEMLQDLTPEILLAMPVDALGAIPQDYFGTLDAETQALLAEKANPAAVELEPVPLPKAWIDAAAGQGVTISTTDDLTPELVGGIAGFAPTMLLSLTEDMLYAMPIDALAALPQSYLLTLPENVQNNLLDRLAALGAGEERDPSQLPESWITGGQAMGLELQTVDDVTPEIIQTLTSFAPQMLSTLSADNLRLLSPEVLGWLPAEYLETLDVELLAELNEIAAPAGGVGALAVAAAEEANANRNPEDLPIEWTNAGKTSDLELYTVYDLEPGVFAGFIQFAPDLLNLLTPDNFRLMDAELLALLPEEFLDTLDADLAAEIREKVAASNVFVPTDKITRVNGNHSLSVQIYKESEANTVAVSHAAFDALDELAEKYPDLEFEIVFEQASFIEESIEGVTREGGLGAVFAVIVILIFLSGRVNNKYVLSWRSTLVTAVSIPLSVLMAFALFKWLPAAVAPLLAPLVESTRGTPVIGALLFGIANLFPLGMTLNIMTLSGMTVAVGRVVDDSIVVLENIYRHIQRGDDQLTSVVKGTRDVSIAIFASTATTVVVFLPIGLMGGVIGSFFLPFGVAVTYALASSFLVAITIVPVLAFLFIRKEHLPPEVETGMQKTYSPVLAWALKNKGATIGIATVLLLGSLFLFGTRPQAFIPNFGEVTITANVDLPDDYVMADTDALVAEFEDAVSDVDGIRSIQVEIGGGGGFEAFFGGGNIDQTAANVSMPIEDPEAANQITAEVREIAVDVFGEENVIVSSGSLSSQGFGGFALVASAEDFSDLEDLNQDAIDTLNDVEGLANVTSNLADVDSYLRVDGEPAIRFSGELETKDTLGVTGLAKEALNEIAPEGVTISEGFESQQQTEGFAQTLQAIGISVVIVYLVMVLTFGSWIHPFTILFSLPMAVIGASVALWITDSILGMSSMIGMMMLVGIVVTNAIVLVDRVLVNIKERGMDVEAALMEGGRTRLRPILMTAIAAILALVPLAIGLSEGAIIAAELAIVVIGGLTTSTLLTLLIVPVMFSILDRFSKNTNGKEKAK